MILLLTAIYWGTIFINSLILEATHLCPIIDLEFASVILNTNANEAHEFVKTFLTAKTLIIIIIPTTCIFLIYLWGKLIVRRCLVKSPCIIYRGIWLVVILICQLTCMRNSAVWSDTWLSREYLSILPKIQKAPNLKKYYSNPVIQEIRNNHPQNVVVIFGESFSKSHCSLYGYSKITNPELARLTTDDLTLFSNIVAPKTNTLAAFKCIMSTYRNETGKNWYECIAAPEILTKAGYYTFWLSNQCPIGLYDNVVIRYAELCDTMTFTYGNFAGGYLKHDGELLKILPNSLADAGTTKTCYFIHLMGSHEYFRVRYPETFEHFTANDYTDHPANQRETMAAYDNSVRYNDYVVREIIRMFEEKESIVIYFPDHGLDLYESRPDFFGHANTSDPKSVNAAIQIPFMIYTSPLYQSHYPDMVRRIKESADKKYNTEDFIYTLMDIIGYRFADNDDVAQYSILN